MEIKYKKKLNKKSNKISYYSKLSILIKLIILVIIIIINIIFNNLYNKSNIKNRISYSSHNKTINEPKENKSINNYNESYYSLKNETIIESNEYDSFNEIKNKLNKDPYYSKIINEIKIIKHIFPENIEFHKEGKNIIHITVGINNDPNYKYILLVSMKSLLINCDTKKSFVIYHILCTPDFNELNIKIFKSLYINNFYNVEMIFYNMGNSFINRKKEIYTQSAYYRLLTPLIVETDRIIHLDGDTLVLTDLSEMYNLDFNDNYVLGFLDVKSYGVDYLGINSTMYINSGVILFNLKKIREDNKTFELINITNSNTKLHKVDQTAINFILYPKIGRLPSKYGIWNYEYKSDLYVYLNFLRTKVPIEELEDAMHNPGIIHYLGCIPKAFNYNSVYSKDFTNCSQRSNCSCRTFFNLWHSFAKKTDYYPEIARATGVKI